MKDRRLNYLSVTGSVFAATSGVAAITGAVISSAPLVVGATIGMGLAAATGYAGNVMARDSARTAKVQTRVANTTESASLVR